MVRILLVDDSQPKRQAIAQIVNDHEVSAELTTAVDVIDAKRALSARSYDLLLLDINLPVRADKPPEVGGGLEVLRWLRGRGQAHRPGHIIGITSFDESLKLATQEFDNLIWRVIPVQMSANGWREQLSRTLTDVAAETRPPFRSDGSTHRTDVLVVTALADPELSAILALPCDFRAITVEHDASEYFQGRIIADRGRVDIVAVAASDKGMTGAAIAAMKGVNAFWPRYVYMPGITAGVKGRTNIGDVVFADLSWDWGSGKIRKVRGAECFKPASYQRRLDETISRAAKSRELDAQYMQRWAQESSFVKPEGIVPKVRVGAMASGASVLQSSDAVRRVIDQHKDLMAIEMEAFSLMFSAQAAPMPRPIPIVAKSVCDNGDGKKNDKYQAYAAEMSARVFMEFAASVLSTPAID